MDGWMDISRWIDEGWEDRDGWGRMAGWVAGWLNRWMDRPKKGQGWMGIEE